MLDIGVGGCYQNTMIWVSIQPKGYVYCFLVVFCYIVATQCQADAGSGLNILLFMMIDVIYGYIQYDCTIL